MSVTVNRCNVEHHAPNVHELHRDGKLIGILLLDRAESEVVARGLRRMQATAYDPTTDALVLRWPSGYEILLPGEPTTGPDAGRLVVNAWEEVHDVLDEFRHDALGKLAQGDEPTVLMVSDETQVLTPLMRTPDGWET